MTDKIVKQIQGYFEHNPEGHRDTYQLIDQIYGDEAEYDKSQRVAVIRAMYRAAELDPRLEVVESQRPHGPQVIYNKTDTTSYASMRIVTCISWGWGNDSSWSRDNDSACDPAVILQIELEEKADLIAEGGSWWRWAEIERLALTGETEASEKLRAEAEAAPREFFAAAMKRMKRFRNGEPIH